MTDQKDDLAPDYIWAMRELGSDDMDAGTFCSVDDGGTKYIREDVVEALLRQARNEALEGAARMADSARSRNTVYERARRDAAAAIRAMMGECDDYPER